MYHQRQNFKICLSSDWLRVVSCYLSNLPEDLFYLLKNSHALHSNFHPTTLIAVRITWWLFFRDPMCYMLYDTHLIVSAGGQLRKVYFIGTLAHYAHSTCQALTVLSSFISYSWLVLQMPISPSGWVCSHFELVNLYGP